MKLRIEYCSVVEYLSSFTSLLCSSSNKPQWGTVCFWETERFAVGYKCF